MTTWARNVRTRRKRKKPGSVSSMTKEGHIVKDCKEKQSIKKQKIQEESEGKDDKEKDKKQGFWRRSLL